MTTRERALGCMLGAAFGDSLGGATEMIRIDEILTMYGHGGIEHCVPFWGFPAGSITDDTQMSIATAKGIVESGISDRKAMLSAIWGHYLEWYDSQSEQVNRRGPGGRCMKSLGEGKMGTLTKPLNDGMGCGGVMRVHPVGLAFSAAPTAFTIGTQTAVMTHGAVEGYLPAGAMAALISHLASGVGFPEAIAEVMEIIRCIPSDNTQNVMMALETAIDAPIISPIDQIESHVGHVATPRGGGWLGHDALAIAVYAVRCALDEPLRAVRIAANHSGDSDSTASMAGAIVGTIHGSGAFVDELTSTGVELEHRSVLESLAVELSKIGI